MSLLISHSQVARPRRNKKSRKPLQANGLMNAPSRTRTLNPLIKSWQSIGRGQLLDYKIIVNSRVFKWASGVFRAVRESSH